MLLFLVNVVLKYEANITVKLTLLKRAQSMKRGIFENDMMVIQYIAFIT